MAYIINRVLRNTLFEADLCHRCLKLRHLSGKNVMDPKYTPNCATNEKVYKLNESDLEKNGGVFSIVLPPPNITGTLHLGHALTTTLQDVLCRWRRMNGVPVCWVPGTDHAGIATQVRVEKHLAKNSLTRESVGYDGFQEELWKWQKNSTNKIYEQLSAMDASLDRSREVFTMDERQSGAVREAFIRLFDKGLIYRANGLINWSCHLRSAISDIEVQSVQITSPTYFNIPGRDKPVQFGLMTEFAYKVHQSSDEIVVATTRPETMLGDTAVAVHPDDKRHQHLIGKRLKHPFFDRTIPVIADHTVDENFGSGAVKITPAHDKYDFLMSKKHDLEILPVIDETGSIEKGFGKFSGMNRYEARDAVIEKLKSQGLFRNQKEHSMTVPVCSRSGDVIELLLRSQWFVDCKRLSKRALQCVEEKSLKLNPDRFEAAWKDWLEKEQDWCISRQLWWGHRIPAYRCYRNDDLRANHVWVAAHNDQEATSKASKILKTPNVTCEQDLDVLDTWFSSGIYPFSSHGWPSHTASYEKLYPLSMMITGHDILCFWVYRMVILGLELTGKLPFSETLLHGVICDSNGAKMSKSKGNVIDPMDIINGITLEELNNKVKESHADGLLSANELDAAVKVQQEKYPDGIPKCGSDSLRFTLCTRDIKNMYINFDVNDCVSNLHFCNKIWQSVRYLNNFINYTDDEALKSCTITDLQPMDKWLLSRLAELIVTVDESFDTYSFHVATSALKKFLYNEMCDSYIELTKFNSKILSDKKAIAANSHTFSVALHTGLRLLSPFMPKISKDLVSHIPQFKNCIYTYDSSENFAAPKIADFGIWKDEFAEEEIDSVLDVISTVRRIKSSHRITKQVKTTIHVDDHPRCSYAVKHDDLISHLSNCDKLVMRDVENPSDMWSHCDNGLKIYLETDKTIFKKINTKDLSEKKSKLSKKLDKLEKTMTDAGFSKAPREVRLSYENKINAMREEIHELNRLMSSS